MKLCMECAWNRIPENLIDPMQIYVSTYCLNETSRRSGLLLTDLPGFIRRHGFEGIELSDRQLAVCTGADLENLRLSCSQENCGLVLNVSCDLTYWDLKLWQREIQYVRRMLGIAHLLDAKCLRICLGGQSFSIQNLLRKHRDVIPEKKRQTVSVTSPSASMKTVLSKLAMRFAHVLRKNMTSRVKNLEAKMGRAVASLKEIMPAAVSYKLPLVIENHWGISSRPENIIEVIDKISSPWLGTCPDFGNFPRDVDPCEGLKLLAPYALHVHAKSARFNEDGDEIDIDYERCLEILRQNDYGQTFTVEYEGGGNDLQGCLKTRELIIRNWQGSVIQSG
ncbi:MAG: sugar phosphate isomerase/epimerase [Deltaproteobacteria bacterium]|nr:MAG: sugar phosphate isomerase/epimerase [Deltaproteobacteria bacterium]